MNCMKCGKVIPAEQVFCEDCLAEMEKYPVKPDTPILLPPKDRNHPPKRASVYKRGKKAEEKVTGLHKIVFWLATVVVVLAVACGVLTMLLIQEKQEDKASPADLPAAACQSVDWDCFT